MKLLVETNGDYSLYDMQGLQVIAAYRPSVVKKTAFIELHRGGKLTVIDELADEAEDSMLDSVTGAEELAAAIAALPRARASKPDPLDHDGDGRKGGSRPKGRTTK